MRENRAILEKLIGKGGQRAYEQILRIAEGEISIEVLAREPKPHEDAVAVAMIPTVRKVPSIRERLDAWITLAEHLNGKAPAALDVTIDDQREQSRPNYRHLSDADLAKLEGLLQKAKVATPEEIDGEIVEPAPEPVPSVDRSGPVEVVRFGLPAGEVGPPPELPEAEGHGEPVSDADLAACFGISP